MANERVWRDAGFLPFEVKELAPQMPLDVPYVEAMIEERRDAFREAQRQGLGRKEWNEVIKDMYADNNWMSKGKADAWKMLRHNEDEWRRTHPEDEYWKLQKPRKKKTKAGYDEKYEKGLTKYPRGAAYR